MPLRLWLNKIMTSNLYGWCLDGVCTISLHMYVCNDNIVKPVPVLKQEKPSASPEYAFWKSISFSECKRNKNDYKKKTDLTVTTFLFLKFHSEILKLLSWEPCRVQKRVFNSQIDIQGFKLWWQCIIFEVRVSWLCYFWLGYITVRTGTLIIAPQVSADKPLLAVMQLHSGLLTQTRIIIIIWLIKDLSAPSGRTYWD